MTNQKTKTISILDYGIGNLFSLTKAFELCGANVKMISQPSELKNVDKLLLPGVGAFAKAMEELHKRDLVGAIKEYAATGKPMLGICLGAQMLLSESHEYGVHSGLDLIKGKVINIRDTDSKAANYKVPYISWSELHKPEANTSWDNTIMSGISPGTTAYFVHSFTFIPDNTEDRLADTFYDGIRLCAAVKNGNIYGTQFHPERSGKYGLKIISNFVEL